MPDINITAILLTVAVMAIPFLTAITFHEVAHGWVAYKLGDPTAKAMGRLTLNPLKHLDPLGTLVLVITRFIGWAKPVPIDPRYFKNPQKGMLLVALAGPVANLLTGTAFAIAFRIWAQVQGVPSAKVLHLWEIMITKIINLSHSGLSGVNELVGAILALALLLNLALAFFNIIPIPPLDGSKILAGILPRKAAAKYLSVGRFGFLLVVLLAAFNLLQYLIWPPIELMVTILL